MAGRTQNNEKLIYKYAGKRNIDGIKFLHGEGFGLEWSDNDGKTPLIVACSYEGGYGVAKCLLERGAKVDACSTGINGGTSMHHAVNRCLDDTVKLLLSYQANALLKNNNGQTALDVARAKGYTTIVRLIEDHIKLFSGHLDVINNAKQRKKMWVVVMPLTTSSSTSRDTDPNKSYGIAVYQSNKSIHPDTVITLNKVKIEEPTFKESDPKIIILDKSFLEEKEYQFLSGVVGDKLQLRHFYDACISGLQSRPSAPSAIDRPSPSEINNRPSATATNEPSATSGPSSAQSSTTILHSPTRPSESHGRSSTEPSVLSNLAQWAGRFFGLTSPGGSESEVRNSISNSQLNLNVNVGWRIDQSRAQPPPSSSIHSAPFAED